MCSILVLLAKITLGLFCYGLFDYMFAYPLTTLAEKLKVYKMVNMTRFQLFALSITYIRCL